MRDIAAAFLDRHSPPASARSIIGELGTHDETLWAQMTDMGWLSATMPENCGELGPGHLAACLLAEEIGKAILPAPYPSVVYLVIEALSLFASDDHKTHNLPRLTSGELLGTVAFAQGMGVITPDKLRTRVTATGISGQQTPVADGMTTDLLIVAVRTGSRDPGLFLIDPEQTGVTREALATIDPSPNHAVVEPRAADGATLPGATGPKALQTLLARAAVMMAFEQLGVAQTALDTACKQARERSAFGQPIGSFQAIRYKFLHDDVSVERARSNAAQGLARRLCANSRIVAPMPVGSRASAVRVTGAQPWTSIS